MKLLLNSKIFTNISLKGLFIKDQYFVNIWRQIEQLTANLAVQFGKSVYQNQESIKGLIDNLC